MRTSVAALGGIALLFVGLFAVGTQADLVQDTAQTSGTEGASGAYNASEAVFEGIAGAGGSGFAIAAGGAVVLVICGVLLGAYVRGGR